MTKGIDLSVDVLKVLAEKLDETMPLRTAMVFVKVAQMILRDTSDPPDFVRVAEELDIPSGLMSRDVGTLSQYSRSVHGGGLDVVEAITDLTDRRRKRLRLTDKGQKIVDELLKRLK